MTIDRLHLRITSHQLIGGQPNALTSQTIKSFWMCSIVCISLCVTWQVSDTVCLASLTKQNFWTCNFSRTLVLRVCHLPSTVCRLCSISGCVIFCVKVGIIVSLPSTTLQYLWPYNTWREVCCLVKTVFDIVKLSPLSITKGLVRISISSKCNIQLSVAKHNTWQIDPRTHQCLTLGPIDGHVVCN